jgi:hypothetical protein
MGDREMHDLLVIGVPVAVILAGILLNRQDVSGLRTEINVLRSEMNGRFDSIEARFDSIHRDMREFYAEQARHDVRINKLEQA